MKIRTAVWMLSLGSSVLLGSTGIDAADKPAKKGAEPAAKAASAAGVTPATQADVAKLLDLRVLGAALEKEKPIGKPEPNASGRHSLASVSCNAGGSAADVYGFLKKQLTAQKWKELPGGYSSDQGASGTFANGDYKLSASVFSVGKPGEVSVSVIHHGNIDPNKLPPPKGGKSLYSTPISCAFLSDASVEDATSAAKELFVKAGWEPYGMAGDTYSFRKNAVKLTVRVSAAPAQGGKTVVDYSTILLAVDIPLFPKAIDSTVQYSDNPAQMGFDSKSEQKEVADYYRATLAKQGWEATTKESVKIDWKNFVIFRNKAKDLMEVQLTTVDEMTRVMVRFQTAAQVEATEKAIQAEIEKKKAEKNKPLPKLAVTIPEGADEVEVTAKRIEFQVEAGKAKATVAALKKQLQDAGWEVEDEMLRDLFGEVSLKKEKLSVEISYTESGILPSEITIKGRGLELEQAK